MNQRKKPKLSYWPPVKKIVDKSHPELAVLAREWLQHPRDFATVLDSTGFVRPPSGGQGWITQSGYDVVKILGNCFCPNPICALQRHYIKELEIMGFNECIWPDNSKLYIFNALDATPSILLPDKK
ncbi:Oidioi.mRNA.OKI2018_I69.PAR.g12704.t1.cds [Oikopleura dioica]|uniref:Oidioi.mRNA.OKI2018_I69.PAR.g12704.t1.cds n=1 Tax=Oikopleura dioica TaxID=34765 RepID=A0ABN7S880_OIKDI|nr:Oidioi.mRNA.OKI2018_I69.PAR.g12704.t1.cds [Oikopleura dioica]